MITPVIEHLVKALVDNPGNVSIVEKRDGNQCVITIDVSEGDLGRVIGKDGQTIRAIRSIALLMAPAGVDVAVDIANQ